MDIPWTKDKLANHILHLIGQKIASPQYWKCFRGNKSSIAYDAFVKIITVVNQTVSSMSEATYKERLRQITSEILNPANPLVPTLKRVFNQGNMK